MTNTIRYTFIGLLVLAAACSNPDQEDGASSTPAPTEMGVGDRAVRVETVTVATGSFEEIIELTGSVEAVDDAILSARSSGTVIRITELGRRVGQGYLAAQLDGGLSNASLLQAQAQLESAEANYSLAQDIYNRQEPLFADSIISALEFEQVRTQLNQAKAQVNQTKGMVAQAEEGAAYANVVAPFSGTIEEHFVEKGEQVNPGTPVVRIVNSRRLKIAAGVPERYAEDIEVGSKARISFKAYGIAPVEATVDFVGRAIRSNSRTFPIELTVSNDDDKLKPEMIATVNLERTTFENVIVVPQSAIVRDESGASVYVVDRSGSIPVAEKRIVKVGPSYSGRIVVESGITVGDELITAGMNDVSPGDRVELVNQSETIAEK